MEPKATIMDELAVRRCMARITHEIIERNQGAENLCLLGVRRRGVPLARMLQENLARFEGITVPMGILDITRHRDDLSDTDKQQQAGECEIPCDINGRHIILVDDVFYTGRTARAAMEAVFSCGRPQAVQLAVLVDRGHRELPIRPDYVGKNVPTSLTEEILVRIDEYDGETAVCICDL